MTAPAFLPAEARSFYDAAYTKSYSRNQNVTHAHEVAWAMTKSRLRKVGETLVCNSEDFVTPSVYTFNLEPASEILITNHDNGDVEVDMVLATTGPRKSDGLAFTEEALAEMAAQINANGSSLPDVDHETLQAIVKEHWPNKQRIISEVKKQKGVFKTLKAAVQDGKLWVKAIFAKPFAKLAEKFKSVSIEALRTPDGKGKLHKPTYLGFTFTHNPQLTGAGVAQ